ncbi:hypothetical protein O0235_01450 [Tepidiforma flava]|uniref:Uncharacterized protein n=1 Tax=Tepidiforma flava TaxID=3004094 RepID=A0ABY7M715_9CHLR|nr:hypothetical protein [Tepidiforma flava]WBL36284.1 hypothetical protein O0235_01450 [Tepidiforma flava]
MEEQAGADREANPRAEMVEAAALVGGSAGRPCLHHREAAAGFDAGVERGEVAGAGVGDERAGGVNERAAGADPEPGSCDGRRASAQRGGCRGPDDRAGAPETATDVSSRSAGKQPSPRSWW